MNIRSLGCLVMQEINVCIRSVNNKLVVSSRDIAVGMDKRHDHVLAKIKEVLTAPEFWVSEYTDSTGRKLPEYMLPKNSFILLLFNYQGYNDFKRAYINRFDEMERYLKGELTLNNREVIDKLFIMNERMIELFEKIIPPIRLISQQQFLPKSKVSIEDVLNVIHRINAGDTRHFTLEELAKIMSLPTDELRPVLMEMFGMQLIDIYKKRPYRNNNGVTRYILSNY